MCKFFASPALVFRLGFRRRLCLLTCGKPIPLWAGNQEHQLQVCGQKRFIGEWIIYSRCVWSKDKLYSIQFCACNFMWCTERLFLFINIILRNRNWAFRSVIALSGLARAFIPPLALKWCKAFAAQFSVEQSKIWFKLSTDSQPQFARQQICACVCVVQSASIKA